MYKKYTDILTRVNELDMDDQFKVPDFDEISQHNQWETTSMRVRLAGPCASGCLAGPWALVAGYLADWALLAVCLTE